MTRLFHSRIVQFGCAALLLSAPSAAHACAVCFGKSDSKMAQAYNLGIFSMLGFVALMFVGVISFFVYLTRRASSRSISASSFSATLPKT